MQRKAAPSQMSFNQATNNTPAQSNIAKDLKSTSSKKRSLNVLQDTVLSGTPSGGDSNLGSIVIDSPQGQIRRSTRPRPQASDDTPVIAAPLVTIDGEANDSDYESRLFSEEEMAAANNFDTHYTDDENGIAEDSAELTQPPVAEDLADRMVIVNLNYIFTFFCFLPESIMSLFFMFQF